MDNDVSELLESAEFRQFHRERQAPRFNVFDVLRYSEYEIRHSNVLGVAAEAGRNSWTRRQVPPTIHGELGSEAAYSQGGLRDGAH